MSRLRRAVLKTALLGGSVAAAAALALGPGSTSALAAGSGDANMTMQASPDFDATTSTPVTLTANFAVPAGAPAPTGTVTFNVDGSTPAGCANVAVTSLQATCAAGTLSAGFHNFTVDYSGDSNYQPTNAGIFLYPVAQTVSSVKVAASDPEPVWGEGVTFTATVTANGKPVTGGTVQWSVDGTAAGSPVAVGAAGTVTLGPLSNLAIGSHTITAGFSGTGQVAASTGSVTVTVGKAATTTTSLTADQQSWSATVRPVAPGAGQPTGTVTFSIGPLRVGTAPVGANGVATLKIGINGRALAFTATYSGDGHFTGSSGTHRFSPFPVPGL